MVPWTRITMVFCQDFDCCTAQVSTTPLLSSACRRQRRHRHRQSYAIMMMLFRVKTAMQRPAPARKSAQSFGLWGIAGFLGSCLGPFLVGGVLCFFPQPGHSPFSRSVQDGSHQVLRFAKMSRIACLLHKAVLLWKRVGGLAQPAVKFDLRPYPC